MSAELITKKIWGRKGGNPEETSILFKHVDSFDSSSEQFSYRPSSDGASWKKRNSVENRCWKTAKRLIGEYVACVNKDQKKIVPLSERKLNWRNSAWHLIAKLSKIMPDYQQ